MDQEKCYYKAYDARYKVIHAANHTWAAENPTPLVLEMVNRHGISKAAPMLEIGCGEGRDSIALLREGYCLRATDVSMEAIRFCKEKFSRFQDCFQVMDACAGQEAGCYDFIFATAVLHMLVEDRDRNAFFRCIRRNLSRHGKALIFTMGDGTSEFRTDPARAYELQLRTNNAAHIPVTVPNTSCAMVSFDTLEREVKAANFTILEQGITHSMPDFDSLMYILLRRKD